VECNVPKLKISRTVVYAIQAMLALAKSEPNRPIPCRQIAEGQDLPPRFLLHILNSLVRKGILLSTSGRGGGFYLARPADAISLFDIAATFDASVQPAEIKGLNVKVRQELAAAASRISASVKHELNRITLADLIDYAEPSLGKLKKSRAG
jgi:Rrf2 family protein